MANSALALCGAEPLDDINAVDNPAAVDCLKNWQQALSQLGRSHTWSCLMTAAVLQPTAQDPIVPPSPAITAVAWAPNTAYVVGTYVTFGSPAYYYQCLIANTSTASFTNDLTSGFWFQTDLYNTDPFNPNAQASLYPSAWAYQYPLPPDFLLLSTLNDDPLSGPEEEYQIIGINLYTNASTAVIKYVQYNTDTTRYDSLFVGCLILLLASYIASRRRQDDTNIAARLYAQYRRALTEARSKDAGERKPRRFSPVNNSRWVASRYFSTNA